MCLSAGQYLRHCEWARLSDLFIVSRSSGDTRTRVSHLFVVCV
jgi:hypothetical protein